MEVIQGDGNSFADRMANVSFEEYIKTITVMENVLKKGDFGEEFEEAVKAFLKKTEEEVFKKYETARAYR